jgi:hypothetical protein
MNNSFNGYSFSWTQPYSNWNHPISSTEKQLIVIQAIDNVIDYMKTYPDAEAIIEKVRNGN